MDISDTSDKEVVFENGESREYQESHKDGLISPVIFDSVWYLSQYIDVQQQGLDALDHYLTCGFQEGRSPNATLNAVKALVDVLFDKDWYEQTYPDVQLSKLPALEHAITVGVASGRPLTRVASRASDLIKLLFDSDWYLAENPDVVAAGLDPIDHFVAHGFSEGRRTSARTALTKPSDIPKEVLIQVPLTDAFIESVEGLRHPHPLVSIVILSYRRPDLAENLIKSILLFTHCPFEVIVVDNGSPPGEHVIDPQILRCVTSLAFQHNRYIGDGYNVGVEHARGEFVVLMNNDIVVQPNWLSHMLDVFRTKPDAGVVGPKFLYPDGRLQEAGAIMASDGYAIQLGKRGNPNSPLLNVMSQVDYCTGATLMCRRKDFYDLLGYDWRWAPGYYEDADFCFKMREKGLKVYYQPLAVVFHLESATMRIHPPTSEIGLSIATNRAAFATRWKALLQRDTDVRKTSAPSTAYSEQISKRKSAHSSPTLGVYLPYEFIPGGGENYIISIALAITPESLIYLIFPELESKLRVFSVLDALGITLPNFEIITLAEAYKMPRFDFFLLLGNEFLPSIKGLGKRNFFNCQFPFPCDHSTLSKRLDAGTHENYEAILVNSNFTASRVKALLASWGANCPVKILYPTCHVIDKDVALGLRTSNTIIGVGRFFEGDHNKRHDVMIEAFRVLTSEYPSLKLSLHLAGAVHREARHRSHLAKLRQRASELELNVDFHISLERDELTNLYLGSKVYWHAAGYGVNTDVEPEKAEHFGITILEAMSAGCIPVVFATGGPLEIVDHGVNGFLVGSIEEMADWSARILLQWDDPKMVQIRQAAVQKALSLNRDTFPDRIRAVLQDGSTAQ